MLRFVWEWAVIAPADLVAQLMAIALGLLPLAAGVGAWVGTYKIFEIAPSPGEVRRSVHRWQVRPAILAWIAALYVALIVGVSFSRVPKAIFMLLND